MSDDKLRQLLGFAAAGVMMTFSSCGCSDKRGGADKWEEVREFVESDSVTYHVEHTDSVEITLSDRIKAYRAVKGAR